MCFNFIVEFWMREVSAVWFRNTVGSQFLKVSMPKDAISLQATVKTASGIHKLAIDRWGDSTHKYDQYNSRRHPTSKDEVAIKRYEADKMVMDPLPSPIPVMKKKNSTRYWPTPREEDIENSEVGRTWHNPGIPTPEEIGEVVPTTLILHNIQDPLLQKEKYSQKLEAPIPQR